MSSSLYDGVLIAGAGQSTYEKKTERSVYEFMHDALNSALTSSGFHLHEVDGLAVTAFVLPPDNVTIVAEHFGLEPRWLFQGAYGGASGIIGMLQGARAIQAGDANVVAVLTADVFDTASHMELMDRFNAPVHDYLAPYGFGGPNGVFALQTRLYMERYGVPREAFGKQAVSQRENARLNENALLRSPLSMEEYLSSRKIAEPLCLYDCVHPCSGADCVVLASEKYLRGNVGPAIRILGGGEAHNVPAHDAFSLRGGWEKFRDRMYEQAHIGPGEIDFVQLYDDYPVMEFIQLESLGFCPLGGASSFLAGHDTTSKGSFPINTGGGQLSAGQAGASGGLIGVVEAVVQLQGRGGARQTTCRRGLVSGYGMVSFGRGLSSSAAILERCE